MASVRQWMEDHEMHDSRRFKEAAETMATLATKEDLSHVMLDQASKGDLAKLSRLLIDDEGQPKFATRKDMEPISSLYQGGVFAKGLVLGFAAVIGAIVGIGLGIYTLVNWFK
jgi:hypothetical protein